MGDNLLVDGIVYTSRR